MEPIILHSDLNNFFASVESVKNPALRGEAFAVAGDPEKRHGIILAKSQEAKRLGVSTGEPIWQAKKKCPNLILVPPDMASYQLYSQKVHAIYSRFTDEIMPFGIDECWLNVSGSTRLFGCGPKIAYEIRKSVREELGLTVSVGVSFNRIFAKLGSDLKKPDATTIISKENYQKIVFPLPVSALLFVGKSTYEKLSQYGIYTIGDLAKTDPFFLQKHFGKIGIQLYRRANGIETDSPLSQVPPEKSISNSVTTPYDLSTPEEIKLQLMLIAEHLASRLRSKNMAGSLITISVRNNALHTLTRQREIQLATNNATEITQIAFSLFNEHYDFKKPVRSIGIGVENLEQDTGNLQTVLWDSAQKRIKSHDLDDAVDHLRSRYGFDCLTKACCLNKHIKNYTLYDPKNPTPFCTLPTVRH